MTPDDQTKIVERVVNRIYRKHFRHADGHEVQETLQAADHFELRESYVWERQSRIEAEAQVAELREALESQRLGRDDWKARYFALLDAAKGAPIMCKCTPEIKTLYCGAIGCEWPGTEEGKAAIEDFLGWSSQFDGKTFILMGKTYQTLTDTILRPLLETLEAKSIDHRYSPSCVTIGTNRYYLVVLSPWCIHELRGLELAGALVKEVHVGAEVASVLRSRCKGPGAQIWWGIGAIKEDSVHES